MKLVLKGIARRAKRNLKIIVPCALVVILAAIGWTIHHHSQKTIAAKKSAVITYSPDKPDETKPDKQTFKWYGQDNDPKYITMPTIKAEGFLQKVGTDQHKQVATPGNIYMAGWFVSTARPGQKGLSIIDGQVNGLQNPGIFKNLGKLKQGDTYTVEFGNGSTKTFKVKRVENVPVAQAADVLFSQDPKTISQLNLITCGGAFNRTIHQYENRIIAVTEAVN